MPGTKIFKWLAGVDIETLNSCSTYERIKHVSIGMLVPIPAILGFISMSYAFSTLTGNKVVYFAIGLVWSCVILVVDRFMLVNFKKSYSILRDFRSSQFILRFILSCFLGIIISHPLVLFIVDPTIQEALTKKYNQTKHELERKYEIQKDSTEFKIAKFQKENVDTIAKYIGCLESFQRAELIEGSRTVNCGGMTYITTGQRGPGYSTTHFDTTINNARRLLRVRMQGFDDFKTRQNESLSRYKSDLDSELVSLKKSFSKDYLSRTTALASIKEGPYGKAAKDLVFWLMCLFILVDIIPIISKVLLPRGEYENKIEKIEELNISLFNQEMQSKKEIEYLKTTKKHLFKKLRILERPVSSFQTKEEFDEFMSQFD